MKYLIPILAVILLISSCGTPNKINKTSSQNNLEDAVVIENDSLEYQIIIYDNRFDLYLRTIARPQNFYSQDFYENKNVRYIAEWNYRAQNPLKFGDFYGGLIEYNQHIDYGLEVNYKLYNYFQFIRKEYGIRLQ